MEETAHDIRQSDTLAAWQQALAEVPATPALSGALLQRKDDVFGRFAAWYGRLRRRPRAERRRWQRQLGLSLAGIALLLAVNGAPAGAVAPAATIPVDGVTCTLADAIAAANTDAATGGCIAGSGADTLNLTANIGLTAALPTIISPITIQGNGNTISRDSGSFRILDVSASTLTVNNVRISGGNVAGDGGGGIRARFSTVTVSNSTLTGNTAGTLGGGIFAVVSPVMISNSTLSGNTASANNKGGGIYNFQAALTVQNSTFSGNVAVGGGGGIWTTGPATISNSTLSGNSGNLGGSIYSNSALTVQESTISGNSGNLGGGVFQASVPATFRSSIVAGQTTGTDCFTFNGSFASNGYNIESGTSCGFNQTGDLQNVSSASLALGALASNGGPTQTRALGLTSVAVDRIPVDLLEANGCGTTVTTDQRGFPRASGATAGGPRCDVGAFEVQVPLAVTLASFDAQAMIDRIQLSWETVSEINNAGFNLYRSASPAAPDALLAYVPSQAPGSTQGASYSFEDMAVSAGQTWYYWLEDVDLNGATSLHGPVSATLQAPTAVTLDALQAQAAAPGSVTPWGALLAALIAAAGVLGVRRRSRAR